MDDTELDQLEGQNDDKISGLSERVALLKTVSMTRRAVEAMKQWSKVLGFGNEESKHVPKKGKETVPWRVN